MRVRTYALVWFLLGGITAALYIAGSLSALTLTVVGFVTATLVFIGMALLLPVSVSQRHADPTY